MSADGRSTRDIVICLETKVEGVKKEISDVKLTLNNHLKHHEDREKEDRKRSWALILLTIGAVLTTACSVIGTVIAQIWCN
jgi:hypothetical protein